MGVRLAETTGGVIPEVECPECEEGYGAPCAPERISCRLCGTEFCCHCGGRRCEGSGECAPDWDPALDEPLPGPRPVLFWEGDPPTWVFHVRHDRRGRRRR